MNEPVNDIDDDDEDECDEEESQVDTETKTEPAVCQCAAVRMRVLPMTTWTLDQIRALCHKALVRLRELRSGPSQGTGQGEKS